MTNTCGTLILGGGITGLAAGVATNGLVLERRSVAGGMCSSYYRVVGAGSYRFEFGGGHWIFGGDAEVLDWIERRSPTRRYERRSAVYFPGRDLFVPYPLQNHLSHLGPATARRILDEIETLVTAGAPPTMAAWLQHSFGPTLCELFFAPFHELYTAGLTGRIAPQDAHKLPIDRALVRAGAQGTSIAVGYNVTFRYPARGLDHLVSTMASECNLQLGAEVTRICTRERLVELTDGKTYPYRRLLSTLPLDRTLALAGLTVSSKPDPHTSVLVLNIGGTAGPRCPDHHWLYVPESRAGFYRVGFYSNVEPSFAPTGSRHGARVSIYVERAFSSGARRDPSENYAQAVIEELRDWGWIDEVEIVDPTWVETAYTWSYPGSQWRDQALSCLEAAGVEMVGRYARWRFQGIADSIREGLRTGTLSDG